MTRTSSRRLSAALVVIALLGLSLPASALGPEGRVPGFLSWIEDWAESLWSTLQPGAPDHSAAPAVGMDNGSGTTDRGALIDPNGSR
jgi:hypothetical protein